MRLFCQGYFLPETVVEICILNSGEFVSAIWIMSCYGIVLQKETQGVGRCSVFCILRSLTIGGLFQRQMSNFFRKHEILKCFSLRGIRKYWWINYLFNRKKECRVLNVKRCTGKLCAGCTRNKFRASYRRKTLRSRIFVFLFSFTEIIPYYTFIKGCFYSPGKISCARVARTVFFPFAFDKCLVLYWLLLCEKIRNTVLWWGHFVVLLPDFLR